MTRLRSISMHVFPFHRESTADCCDVEKTVGDLPDGVLLEIFALYSYKSRSISAWHTLIHVCPRWRDIVFGSPCRLELQLECTPMKTLKKTLEVWPPFPLVIKGKSYSKSSGDNIVAMLKHNDRVFEIDLLVLSSLPLENVMTVMQEPFPMLSNLKLCFAGNMTPVVLADPELFLGGSAGSLRSLTLEGIPFPSLPALLLTATNLVHLTLSNIPHSGYISPISIVICLSTLDRLETVRLEFESPLSRPDRNWRLRLPRRGGRSVLRALTTFFFKGVFEYLEDLVARIDAPQLADLRITFFNELAFDTPELAQFIERTPTLTFGALNEARVEFYDSCVGVILQQANSHRLHLRVSCRPSDWQLGSLAQLCTSSLPRSLILMVERLYIFHGSFGLHWQDDIDKSQCLEFLQPFTRVKDLYLSWGFVSHIVPALQELAGERVTEVLPALQSLFWEGFNPSGLDKLTDARRRSNHPIAVSNWERAGYVVGGP